MRLNPLGGFTWTRRFNSAGNHTEMARAMAVTDAGSIYVVGTLDTAGQQSDYQTIKYRWDGLMLW